jgi:hypothetical protein
VRHEAGLNKPMRRKINIDKCLQEGTVGSLRVHLSHKPEVNNLVGTMEIHCIRRQVDYKKVRDFGTPDREQGHHQPNFDFVGEW